MLTEKYLNLSIQEQREFIGSLLHAAQTNERCYEAALQIVEWAQRNGVLDRVKILPDDWHNPKIQEDEHDCSGDTDSDSLQ